MVRPRYDRDNNHLTTLHHGKSSKKHSYDSANGRLSGKNQRLSSVNFQSLPSYKTAVFRRKDLGYKFLWEH